LIPITLIGCAPEIEPLSEEDISIIRGNTVREAVEATLAEDWDRFAAGFTEDAIRMPPNEPLHEGREAIRQWAEAVWGPTTITAFAMTAEDVDGYGDLAYAWGAYSATVEVPGMEAPLQDIGKYLVVLRKQQDGEWLVSVAMFNSDSPMPTPGAAN